ncbi:anti-sigma factor domain-containing protein [Paenibacillus marinisediminis]
MNNTTCNWKEEDLIDYVLVKLPEHKRDQLTHHLQTCHSCKQGLLMWQQTLTGTQAALHDDPQLQQQESLMMPSKRIKRKLMFQVLLNKLVYVMKRPITTVSIAACLVLFLIVASFEANDVIQEVQPPQWTQEMNNIEGSSLIGDPQTIIYRIERLPQLNMDGYAWIKGKSHELLFLFDGLAPSQVHDYQMWAVTKNNQTNIGLLRYNQGKAYLYFNGRLPQTVKNFAVSIEPKGGSKVPTNPFTFNVVITK